MKKNQFIGHFNEQYQLFPQLFTLCRYLSPSKGDKSQVSSVSFATWVKISPLPFMTLESKRAELLKYTQIKVTEEGR